MNRMFNTILRTNQALRPFITAKKQFSINRLVLTDKPNVVSVFFVGKLN